MGRHPASQNKKVLSQVSPREIKTTNWGHTAKPGQTETDVRICHFPSHPSSPFHGQWFIVTREAVSVTGLVTCCKSHLETWPYTNSDGFLCSRIAAPTLLRPTVAGGQQAGSPWH